MDRIQKIIKEEYEKFINEGLSDILYHFTYVPHAINILKTNKFVTSSNLGTSADAMKDRGKFFYFSTQRSSGKSGYGRSHGDAIFVLDGAKLMQRYKGFPTDYWNWSKKRSDYSDKQSYMQALQSTEMEDRIVTDKPYIENAKNYILEIHIFFANWYAKKKDMELLKDYAEINDIPIYFYDNQEAFRLMDKRKAVNFEETGHEFKEPDENEYTGRRSEFYYMFKRIMPYILLDTNLESEFWKILQEFLKSKNETEKFDEIKSEISKKAIELERDKRSGYYRYADYRIKDAFNSFSADLHNNKGSADPYYREFLRYLIIDMKRMNAKSFKEYLYKKLGVEEI